MAVSFSNINPFYPRETLRNMFYENLKLTTNEVFACLKKDYTADIKAFDTVQKEILKISKFFVDGIVKQFPNSFYSFLAIYLKLFLHTFQNLVHIPLAFSKILLNVFYILDGNIDVTLYSQLYFYYIL